MKKTKSILINFAGKPVTMGSLYPDNGLANLAGSLIEKGHETLIADFSVVDSIQDFALPKPVQKQVTEVTDSLLDDFRLGKINKEKLAAFSLLKEHIGTAEQDCLKTVYARLKKLITEFNPDFIGFKLWNGDGFSGSVSLAEWISRDFQDIKLFAGGPHVDWFMERIYQVTRVFTALAYGEGEETIVDLADHASGSKALRNIPNIIYLSDGTVRKNPQKRISDLNDLPYPVYDSSIYPAMAGNQKIKMAIIDESRGCPFTCKFCIQPVKSGNNRRIKSPARVVDEIQYLQKTQQFSLFHHAGSNTPFSLSYDIARLILDRGVDLSYISFAHAREGDRVDYSMLHKAGCKALFFGLESGSQELLDRMNKTGRIQHFESSLNKCKGSGIKTVTSVIFPLPFETSSTRRETIELLKRIRPDGIPIQSPGVLPYTDWFENPRENNVLIPDKERYLDELMHYKIRFLFPQFLWDSLPLFINGKPFSIYSDETSSFTMELESAGLPTHISHDMVVLSELLGISPKELRDLSRDLLIRGDATMLGHFVEQINSRIFSSSSSMARIA